MIGIESEMIRETRDYLTPGELRRGVLTIITATEVPVQEPEEQLTIYLEPLSIIMATEVPVQEPEEQRKPGRNNRNYFFNCVFRRFMA